MPAQLEETMGRLIQDVVAMPDDTLHITINEMPPRPLTVVPKVSFSHCH